MPAASFQKTELQAMYMLRAPCSLLHAACSMVRVLGQPLMASVGGARVFSALRFDTLPSNHFDDAKSRSVAKNWPRVLGPEN